MLVPQKSQYALRAVFELAKRERQRPVKAAEIAQAQAIPLRFLEVILNELKQGGIVVSHRGNRGGYLLARPPARLTVRDVIEFMDGPIGPVDCVAGDPADRCPLYGRCVFLPMWEKVQAAMVQVYGSTTFQDLVDEEMHMARQHALSYSI